MRILIFLCVVFIFSCKNDPASSDEKIQTEEVQKEVAETQKAATESVKEKVVNPSLPYVCDLVTDDFIAGVMNIPVNAILEKPTSSKFDRACFFKWEEDDVANAGAMVQVSVNPVADEVPNFFEMLLTGKRLNGEQDVHSDKPVKYQTFSGFGDDGVYSSELGKYLFRLDNDYGFMVAFNSGMNEKEQVRVARLIAAELWTNFQKI